MIYYWYCCILIAYVVTIICIILTFIVDIRPDYLPIIILFLLLMMKWLLINYYSSDDDIIDRLMTYSDMPGALLLLFWLLTLTYRYYIRYDYDTTFLPDPHSGVWLVDVTGIAIILYCYCC